MRSRYYHVVINGEPKVNVLRVIRNNSQYIKRFDIVRHEQYASLSNLFPHTHIALEVLDLKSPIWISRRFKVKLSCIELCHSSIIFDYLKAAKGAK